MEDIDSMMMNAVTDLLFIAYAMMIIIPTFAIACTFVIVSLLTKTLQMRTQISVYKNYIYLRSTAFKL